MRKKYSYTLIVIAVVVAACAPAGAGSEAPKNTSQPAALVPVAGELVVASTRVADEPRLWSGEILVSDNDSPDQQPMIQGPVTSTVKIDVCASEDDLERKYGGCIE